MESMSGDDELRMNEDGIYGAVNDSDKETVSNSTDNNRRPTGNVHLSTWQSFALSYAQYTQPTRRNCRVELRRRRRCVLDI